jgi:uncharacterized protein YjbJ (UPF0337 family)
LNNYPFKKSARHLQKEIAAASCAVKNNQKSYMSALAVKGNWNIAKGKVKQTLARLTDDDLQFIEGKEDELIGRIQKRTSQTKLKIEPSVNECASCRTSRK